MPQQINSVAFGVLSDEDIEKMSVCLIDKPALSSDPGCIYDGRLGVSQQTLLCQTCNKNVWECPGHFGHIELNTPVILYYKAVLNMLRCFCLNCSRLICLEGELSLNNIKGYDRVISYLGKLKMGICAHCQTPHPEIRYSVTENLLTAQLKHKSTKTIRDLSVAVVKGVFDKIPDSDVRLFGVDVEMFHPKNLVLTKFPVIPISCRPKMHTPDNTSDDDLSVALSELIKLNNSLINEDPKSDKYQKVCAIIRSKVLSYCDNSKGNSVHNTNHKPLKGIKERIDKKEGIIRKNLMGKRCDQTGRTVIGPDPTLKLTQVAVPRKMAEILTVPEYVTPYNKDRLTKIVNDGKAALICQKNGSKKIVSNALYKNKIHLRHGDKVHQVSGKVVNVMNCKMELTPGDVVLRANGDKVIVQPLEKHFIELKDGECVERFLQDGDVGLLNRQPTLHKNSMQAMQVVIKDGKTLRLNLSQTPGFNADFDGDEMNFSICKSEVSKAELLNLSLSKQIILSSQTNKPMMAIVQDSLLAAYKMTKNVQKVDRGQFMDFLMKTDFAIDYDYLERLEEIRKIRNEPGMFTTPMLFGFIMPRDFFIDYEDLKIEYGVVACGHFKKDNLGCTKRSLLRVLTLEYGDDIAERFINNIQFITNAWLEVNGFSIGVDDCFIPQDKTDKIEEMISKSFMEAEQAYRTTDNQYIRESRVHCSLNKLSDSGKRFAAEALKDDNNILTTVRAGSKGDYYNSTQISGVVGQQNVYGKRPSPTMSNNTRSLPHYPKKIPDMKRRYESRGFVANSFFKGLNPQESFFHAMSGREGMINTAMGTSESGYNQRKTVKINENLTVNYDGSVRGPTGNIYQFVYGYSGFDPAKVTIVNGEQHPCDVARLARKESSHYPLETPIPFSVFEIEEICKKTVPVPVTIPVIRDAIVTKHTSELKRMLENVKVSPSAMREFQDKLVTIYHKALITPGEAVGIQAAQSIGEKQTQLTLNTFHTAGKLQQTGVGRFLELLDVKKNLKVKTCTLYFKKKYETAEELRKAIGCSIVKLRLGDIVENTTFDGTTGRIVYTLDTKKLYKNRLNPVKICKVLSRKTTGFKFTPKASSIIIEIEDGEESLNDGELVTSMFIQEITKELGKVLLCGIDGIEKMFLQYENNEWSVITAGSNLKKFLAHPLIDPKRIYCNNMWEVLDCLGLVAMKKMLFEELKKNIVGINPEHIQLLVDKMTFKGKPMPVNRYTMRTNDVGPLCKATFEESTDNIISAAMRTEVDQVKGVSASIMCGNKIRMGTGAFDLHIDYMSLMGLQRNPKNQYKKYPNKHNNFNQINQFDFSDLEEEEEDEDDIRPEARYDCEDDEDEFNEDYNSGYEEEAVFDDDVYDGLE